jgi:hypothetical protein
LFSPQLNKFDSDEYNERRHQDDEKTAEEFNGRVKCRKKRKRFVGLAEVFSSATAK